MADRVKISVSITSKSQELLDRLGTLLVPGVQLSRGAVVDFLVADRARLLRMGDKPGAKEQVTLSWGKDSNTEELPSL